MPTAALHCQFVEEDVQIEALAEPWRALPTPQPAVPAFLAPAWYAQWRRCFGATTRNGVLTCWAGERLLGTMPIMIGRVARGPALSVQFDFRPGDRIWLQERPRFRFLPLGQISPAMALEAGMLRGGLRAEPGWEQACRESVLNALPELPGWSVAVLPVSEAEAGAWAAALRGSGQRGFLRRSHLRFFSRQQVLPFEEIMRSRSRKFRKGVIHAVNHAHREGLTVRVHAGPGEALTGLDALFTVARTSWKSTGRTGLQFWTPPTDAVRRFYQDLARDGSGDVRSLVAVIYDGTEPRAGMSAVVCQGVMLLCLTYYDPAVASIYPGRLLMKTLFEFNATHEWTEPFSDRTDVYLQLLVFNRGAYAGLLHQLSRRLSPLVTP